MATKILTTKQFDNYLAVCFKEGKEIKVCYGIWTDKRDVSNSLKAAIVTSHLEFLD